MDDYTYNGNTLKRGSTGDDVTSLQKALNQLGYGLDEDGIFGEKTEEALKNYQSNVNNNSSTNVGEVDGILGAKTGAALQASLADLNNANAYLASNNSTTKSSSNSDNSSYGTSLEEYLAGYQAAQQEEKQNIEDYYTKLLEQTQAQNDYTTEQNVKALKQQWEDSINTYNQERANTAYSAAQAKDNMVLRNTAAGDLGGIGNKLYSDQQADYDAAMLNIDLEQANLKNDIDRQVQDYIAQGDYENAQAALELGIQKMSALSDLSNNYWSTMINAGSTLDNYKLNQEQLAAQLAEAQKESSGVTYDQLYDAGITSQEEAYLALLNAGYSSTEAQQTAEYYQNWLDTYDETHGTVGGPNGYNTVDRDEVTDVESTDVVTNQHSDSWVYVPGLGRITYQQLRNKVNDGSVVEIEGSDGSLTYTLYSPATTTSNNTEADVSLDM